jgi:probable phosphoglycerate mutase
VYLVRHGETDWNREQRLQGVRNIPINSVGAQQASWLAERLSLCDIRCVISSPLARARETAAVVADACGCPVVIDARLAEVDHGLWTGWTLPEIASEHPSLVAHGQLLPEAFDVNCGEPLTNVFRRVSAALHDVVERHHGESIVVVGHGVALGLMACAANGAAATDFYDHMPPNAGIVALTFNGTAESP